LTSTKSAFAGVLFSAYPDFRPTRALYLDFEGSLGNERILSLFWPRKLGADRLRLLWRGSEHLTLGKAGLVGTLDELGCDPDSLGYLVVFSGGVTTPDEKVRFEEVFGTGFFSEATWINLHEVLRECPEMMRAIRARRHCWFTEETRVRYSLENLEREFGIYRPVDLRSHSHSYGDGSKGLMNVLELVAQVVSGKATEVQAALLTSYCLMDVSSMFKICRACQNLIR
jgi:hypothetical protein